MIIVLDNYDSFTYNLVHYIGELKKEVKVIRNDEMTVSEVLNLAPEKIVISPGPCTPDQAGISVELIKSSIVPILGVCLGHQAIGAAFGGNIIKAPEVFHGKISSIKHMEDGLFKDISSPYNVVRYHSLVIDMVSFPEELKITATLENDPNVIMAVEHKKKPIYGVQFHPESIDTVDGKKLIQNFIESL